MTLRWYDRALKQTVTVWEPGSKDEWGKVTWSTPVTISARWEERREEFLNDRGQIEVSQAVVNTNTSVSTGAWVFLGTSTASDPTTVSGAFPVKRSQKIPSLNAKDFVYRLFL